MEALVDFRMHSVMLGSDGRDLKGATKPKRSKRLPSTKRLPTTTPNPVSPNNKVYNETVMLPSMLIPGGETKTEIRKRDLGAGVALGVGVLSLFATIGSQIYFASELADVRAYISSLEDQIEADAQLSKRIAVNIQTLKKHDKLIAVRLQSFLSALVRLRDDSACSFERDFIQDQVSHLQDFFALLYEDILSSRISSRILPLDALKKVISTSPELDHSLISTYPTSFYAESKISILSVNRKTKSLRLILVSPNIRKHAEYVHLSILSPAAPIRKGGKNYRMSLDLPVNPFAIELSRTQEEGFDVLNLTRRDVGNMVALSDCGTISGVEYCRSVNPLVEKQRRCLTGLFTKDLALQKSCKVRIEEDVDEKEISVVRGISGMALSTAVDFSAYIYENGKRGAYLGGSSGKLDHLDHSVCVFVPSLHPSIKVVAGGKSQIIKQRSEVTLSTAVGVRKEAYSTHHIKWYPSEHEDWSEGENLTEVFEKDKWENMERKIVHVRRSYYSLLYWKIAFVCLCVWILILTYFCVKAMCKNKKISSCSTCCDEEAALTSPGTEDLRGEIERFRREVYGELQRNNQNQAGSQLSFRTKVKTGLPPMDPSKVHFHRNRQNGDEESVSLGNLSVNSRTPFVGGEHPGSVQEGNL